MKLFPLLAPLCLIACGNAPDPSADQAEPVADSGGPVSVPGQKPAFHHDEKTDLVEFAFGWSAEAAAVPELARRFEAELANERSDLIDLARTEKAYRDKEGFDFNRLTFSRSYETAGQSERLLSLRIDSYSYTGGAHGNGGTTALLWDRSNRDEIPFADLFSTKPSRDQLLVDRWCSTLDAAREEKRGEPVGNGGMFDECPPLDDIAIIPSDKDSNGRFEQLLLVASPYVAGPYVEGEYEIALPVTSAVIAALKPKYRTSFEAQSGQ